MNVREGFRRIGLASATVYGLALAAVVLFVAWDGFFHEENGVFGTPIRTYTLEAETGGKIRVKAGSEEEAMRLAAESTPPAADLVYNERLRILEPPLIYSPYNDRLTFWGATKNVGLTIFWGYAIYLGFSLIWRGLGWVFGGFFLRPDEA